MRAREVAIVVLTLAGVGTAVAPGAAARGERWLVAGGTVVVVCPLTVGGSFETRTADLTGELATSDADPSALEGALQVDLSTLDTGIGLRTTHLKERYLEIHRGEGFTHAVLSRISLAAPVATAAGRTTFTGSFTLHGVTRPVSGTAQLTRAGDRVRVEATFPVAIPDHDIPKPRYLGVGVRDQVQVRVAFTADDGGGSPQE